MEKKNRIIRRIVLAFIIIISIVVIFFVYKNIKTKVVYYTKSSKELAKSMIKKYNDVYFGKESKLVGNVIESGGVYNLSGDYNCIQINTASNVKLNLNNVNINCANGPAIKSSRASVVYINISGNNYVDANIDSNEVKGAIYSKKSLVFSGDGNISIISNYDGIVALDNLVFESGNYIIDSSDDGIRGKDSVNILGGNYTINSTGDGIKATNSNNKFKGYVSIEGGNIFVNTQHDGIQAVSDIVINGGVLDIKTNSYVTKESSKGLKAGDLIEINDGDIMIDSFDDGIHSNGNLVINGGNINVKSLDDAISGKVYTEINDGVVNLDGVEGLDISLLKVNGSKIVINAEKNGISVSRKKIGSLMDMYFNGGDIEINSKFGCGINYKCNLYLNGSSIKINAMFPLDYLERPIYESGEMIINGEKERFGREHRRE